MIDEPKVTPSSSLAPGSSPSALPEGRPSVSESRPRPQRGAGRPMERLLVSREGRSGRYRHQRDIDHLSATASDRDQLLIDGNRLAVLVGLQTVLSGLETNLFRSRTGDDDVLAFNGDADVRIVDRDDQSSLARHDADHGGRNLGHAGGFGDAQAGEDGQQHEPDAGPDPASRAATAWPRSVARPGFQTQSLATPSGPGGGVLVGCWR